MKRKRRSCSNAPLAAPKRSRTLDDATTAAEGAATTHKVLCHYYPRLQTLKQYLVSKLPATSKRRRKILQFPTSRCSASVANQPLVEVDELQRFLDTILVGTTPKSPLHSDQLRAKDLQHFSQQISGSTAPSTSNKNASSVSNLVDFAVWLLFNKTYPTAHKPPHILCHGTQRASATWQNGCGISIACRIPGLVSIYPNEYVESLKGPCWAEILALLGKDGENILLDLILDNAVFVPIGQTRGSFYQLSGVPMHELKSHAPEGSGDTPKYRWDEALPKSRQTSRSPAQIRFVRHRILYARAALNSKGEISFGLRRIHAFNRFNDETNPKHAAHIMMYIFPRQFGLHNVFTSNTDPLGTVQQFQDYTLREHEVFRARSFCKAPNGAAQTVAIPSRLRGTTLELFRRLQLLHNRCSYSKLLEHYCNHSQPAAALTNSTGVVTTNIEDHQLPFTELATRASNVSAFCRAAVRRVFPICVFGDGKVATANQKVILQNIDAFVKARRFESLTLQQVTKGIKIHGVSWLRPSKAEANQKMSITDFKKRQEIFFELIYYIFDSFIMPLIRSNFHVTESTVNRNQVFYFRHDVWRRMTEPALTSLKNSMFEEMRADRVQTILDSRTLGYSQVRLLPKEKGMRPIANLRRRIQIKQNGKKILGRSINSVIGPVFNVLKYEKRNHNSKFGASLFSVGEIHTHIRAFRNKLRKQGLLGQPLYFVKVDIKSAFDSLPQRRVLDLIRQLLSTEEYSVARHAEIKAAGKTGRHEQREASKPTKKFQAIGLIEGDYESFEALLAEQGLASRPNTVFVDSVLQQTVRKRQVLDLLEEHVLCNIVKFGKKFYRQKQGIPQGSILSSLLCNLLYADFEKTQLGFLTQSHSLLLRLLDDFLVITTSREQAECFLDVMAKGCPEYGVEIKFDKTFANFDATVGGRQVPRLTSSTAFPYCGLVIDSASLDISKDVDLARHGRVGEGLTVEYSKTPGHTFHRKTLAAMKLQMHTMLLDTSHNSKETVLRNLMYGFVETARKCLHYIRCLRGRMQPTATMIIKVIDDVIELAFALMKSEHNRERCKEFQCKIRKGSVSWLGCRAFLHVFRRRQTKFSAELNWLRQVVADSTPETAEEGRLLETVERGLMVAWGGQYSGLDGGKSTGKTQHRCRRQ